MLYGEFIVELYSSRTINVYPFERAVHRSGESTPSLKESCLFDNH
jgi:hypothetical protein